MREKVNKIVRNTYMIYTVLFVVCSMICFSYFMRYGKSMIWKNDGLYQHYNAFLYLGSWCRSVIKNLIFNHKLVIPMWEWGLGYGADVVTTLSYYVFGDPFALVSVVTPFEYGEIGYTISILLRFYAAGVTFCLFSRKMGCKKWGTVCGALTYVFCSYSLYAGVRHPYFIGPMIYLPLILFGCEKIIRKESPIPYVLAVAVSALSNFYFFYMIVILTVLYVVIRIFSEKEYRKGAVIGRYLVRFLLFAVLGVALAAVLFLPNVMAFLGTTRVNDIYKYHFLYSRQEYESLVGAAVGITNGALWTQIGLAPIVYIGAIGLIMHRKKENRWAAVYLICEIIFLIFPFFGHLFNGFGYVCNRWIFAWAFLLSYMFAKSVPMLFELSLRKKGWLTVGSVLYIILIGCLEGAQSIDVYAGCVLVMLSVVYIWTAPYLKSINYKRFRMSGLRIRQCLLLLLVLCTVYNFTFQRYSFTKNNYIETFHDQASANGDLDNSYRLIKKIINDKSFYRIENRTNMPTSHNVLATTGQSTTACYWSLINPNINEFMKYNSAYNAKSYTLRNADARAMLLPLFDAKYYLRDGNKSDKAYKPYGFKKLVKIERMQSNLTLYKTKNSLPFGYTYDSVISLDEYKTMSFAERQQAMLQGAVVDEINGDTEKLANCSPTYDDYSVPYQLVYGKNVEEKDGKLIIKEPNTAITLIFDAVESCELYLQMRDYEFESQPQYLLMDQEEKKELTEYDTVRIKNELKYWIPADRVKMSLSCGEASYNLEYYTEYNMYAEGRKDFLVNLGYSKQSRNSIMVTFDQPGIYSMSDLSVVCQPMDNLKEYTKALKVNSLKNVSIKTNYISGTIELDQSKLLCLSLPYTDGWTLKVDGQEKNIIRTNIMFSGVVLDAGKHRIELSYRTPYLKIGCIISFAAFIVLILYIIITGYKASNIKKQHLRIGDM